MEIVDVDEPGCEAGKDFKFQCKECKCNEDGKKASCPKWIKCCKKGEKWSTNSCNLCECNEKYEKICIATTCRRSWQ